ncbi:MAG: alpha-hydroxy-acid oxidizing protein [Actinobacteria bacterium]|nr:alpha-hydroxy-acid oxidizing protein [Actinomycetota bacterium]MCA1720929.1 alpha-hydroxy-acid oxidizing protein [Actinomycetota bacterium]
MAYADYQNEVYLNGLADQTPAFPVGWRDLEAAAHVAMTPGARGYVAGGAGGEDTMRANREAFDRWRILPRMLRGVPAQRDLTTTLLGTTMPAPLMLAPVGVLGIVHEDRELAVARAAAALGITMVLSTAATSTMEEVAEVGGPRWYQLYWPKSRELAASFVQRAEKNGYDAVVFTLDTWQLGWRPRDIDAAYLPFLRGQGNQQYFADPVFRDMLEKTPEEDPGAAVLLWSQQFANPTLTWEDLTWLKEQTSLPIVLKGVQHRDDARRAADAGVAAIICSNHGGRQVDGAVGALDALPGVVDAAADLPVLFDSGIRTGADAVKALALGAQAVLLARPYVYGLALGGEEGVRHVLRTFLADLDLQLGLSGHTSVAELTAESLVRQ